MDIVIISVLAVVCYADGWSDNHDFGKAREAWLRGSLELPNGIPCDDGGPQHRAKKARALMAELDSDFRTIVGE